MAHGHHHVPDPDRPRRLIETSDALTSARTERAIWATVIACAVVTVIGLVLLWPGGDDDGVQDPALLGGDPVKAVVRDVEIAPCPGTSVADAIDCRLVELEITSGPTAGDRPVLTQSVGASGAQLGEGDRILVSADPGVGGEVFYSFYDYQRSTPLALLGLLFVAAVLLLGRWKGLGALGGLGASLVVLAAFVLPSLLDGNNPIAVALVGASIIAFIALFLAHGVNVATAVALIASFASLALTGLLGWAFVRFAKFTGYTEDSSFFLDALGLSIDPRGILLAGIVIGSLGVLDDVTVTQVSAVWQLREARPDAAAAELYRSAVVIGRDHISSTVNTLVLAYAGASLPLLLLFTEAQQGVTGIVGREVVAVEIVRALVGSIGLVASVPISTWLASQALVGRAVRGAA
jgi:uncharacterized membrane protein